MILGWVLVAGCAADPVPAEELCVVDPVPAGEVRAGRIVCVEQLVVGGEGRVGDWLLENSQVRYVVRDSYASLTQLGEEGGGLVDASLLGGPDLLMELLPLGERSPVSATVTEDGGAVSAGAFTWQLAPDDPQLQLITDSGEADAIWVPRPGVVRTTAVTREGADFLAVGALGEVPPGGAGGQLLVEGLVGVQPSAAVWYATSAPIAGPIDADAVDLFAADGGHLDRIPVVAGEAGGGGQPEATTAIGFRPGCVYDGLTKGECGGLTVTVRDEDDRPLAATVHFDGEDFPLPEGGGRAALGPEEGEAWVWAGPGFSAWRGWFAGGEERAEIRLTRVLPAEREWPAEATAEAPATWSAGGVLLADFAVQAAPDADHAAYSADALHAARAEGVGFAVLLADDEVPVAERYPHDDLRAAIGSRSGGDAWTWGANSTTRRAAHGAPNWLGFSALDRLTLVRGGAGADRFTIVTRGWVEEATALGPAWSWPVRPSALWLDGPDDVGTLAQLCEAWVDVQPLAHRTWLPYVGATSATAALRSVYDRTASAGNGPMVSLVASTPSLLGAPRPDLTVEVFAAGWMGAVTAALHTPVGARELPLDPDGRATAEMHEPGWAFVVVQAERSLPWGGAPAWAVSGVRWFDQPS